MIQLRRAHVHVVILLLSFLSAGPVIAASYITPTEKVAVGDWPNFIDDLDFSGMSRAINRQLKKFDHTDLNGTIQFGADQYTLSKVKDSLVEFQKIIGTYKACRKKIFHRIACGATLNDQMKKSFNLYKPHLEQGDPRFGEPKATFFTGYYTPLMTVSKSAKGNFQHPIYATPPTEKLQRTSRVDIDFKGALSGLGLELFYATSIFDLYLMHVEGGGHLIVKNGDKKTSQYISYDTENGMKFQFIEKYMMEKKWIPDSSNEAQRDFLNKHPELQEEIYNTCPSYVFYKLSSTPPEGSGGVPLTDNRSIATDSSHYHFKGVLSFISTKRPDPDGVDKDDLKFEDFSRFFLDQDTGGAIRGKARVDLYFGEGSYAEYAASNEIERGDLYFLMLK